MTPVPKPSPAAEPETFESLYARLLALPEHQLGQILDGELHVQPRPNFDHAEATTSLVETLGPPFRRGNGGPGGWVLQFEPELHLDGNVLVPDLAGWRRERLPDLPKGAPFFTLAPDWICEVLSPSTARIDRIRKMRRYATQGVGHAWLIDPNDETLEVYRLGEGSQWVQVGLYEGAEKVRAQPFDAIELDLSLLWVPAPPAAP